MAQADARGVLSRGTSTAGSPFVPAEQDRELYASTHLQNTEEDGGLFGSLRWNAKSAHQNATEAFLHRLHWGKISPPGLCEVPDGQAIPAS